MDDVTVEITYSPRQWEVGTLRRMPADEARLLIREGRARRPQRGHHDDDTGAGVVEPRVGEDYAGDDLPPAPPVTAPAVVRRARRTTATTSHTAPAEPDSTE